MPVAYPKRPQFFSLRFLRLLSKSCAVQELGQGAVWLLTTIALTEDAKRYTGAVAFFNDQLLPIAGFRSWDALNDARQRAIDLGWLHYEPGGKHVAGRYWVTIPDRLEVLSDAPLGEVDPASISHRADGSLIETGSKHTSSGVDQPQSGRRADGERTESGRTPEHSILSPEPIPVPVPASPGAAVEPRVDPNEQDITTPSVPRSDVPRGSKNDSGPQFPVPEIALGTWIRWRVSDQARTEENRQALRMYAERYGIEAIQRVAEALVLRGDADRQSRPPGSKCWPDEILPELIRTGVVTTHAPVSLLAPSPANPSQPAPLPAIVVQAHALLAQHGAAACRTALGWPNTTAPTDQAMRTALEREALANDLVDAFVHGPLVVTNP